MFNKYYTKEYKYVTVPIVTLDNVDNSFCIIYVFTGIIYEYNNHSKLHDYVLFQMMNEYF